MIFRFYMVPAILIAALHGAVNGGPATKSRGSIGAPFKSHCLTNASVEKVMRSRFEVATALPRPNDYLLDTLSISGSTFTIVTNDSVCTLARAAYVDIYHGYDSTRKAQALAGFPAVMVISLKADRMWIATTEFDDTQLYRRVLVDSLWNVVTRQF